MDNKDNSQVKNVLEKIVEENQREEKTLVKEKPFSAYDSSIFNDNEDLPTENYAAEKIRSFNNIFLISNIIVVVILVVLFFVYDCEYISFVIAALSVSFVALFAYYLVNGLVEIINLLDEIKQILKNTLK